VLEEATPMPGSRRLAESLAVTVHGPAGVLDLVVPPEATAADVAEEYAALAGTARPALLDRLGRPFRADGPLADAGVRPGDLLVAAAPEAAAGVAAEPAPVAPAPAVRSDRVGVWWCAVAAAAALLAAWCGARSDDQALRDVTVGLLGLGVLLTLVPAAAYAGPRLATGPVLGGAVAFVLAWHPAPERLPVVAGAVALAAAVVAAVARALDRRADEPLRVWVVAGLAVFALTGATTLADLPPRVPWALLLLGAVLMARFVPALAVDVPDHYLLDLDRLAVTAWSARERPTGRRGRTVVPPDAVAEVARRGTRLVAAAAVAVLAVVALSAPLLLATATLPLDRIGARVLVGLAGAALLLAARSYRHPPARALLRLAGLAAWLALAVALLPLLDPGELAAVTVVAVLLAGVLVVAAVATGRGWRSAWWSRRAEVAEGLAGAGAIAAVLVAVGLFRRLWELTS
jgi:hypothetical protein